MVQEPQTIDEFVTAVFDHEVTEPAWHFSEEALIPFEYEPERALPFVIQVFENAEVLLQKYPRDKAGSGLWFMVSEAGASYLDALFSKNVEFSEKDRLLKAVGVLFSTYFSKHAGAGKDEDDWIDLACHMWWDIGVRFNFDRDPIPEVGASLLREMTAQLESRNPQCIASGLHGLGHMFERYPEQVKEIAGSFLASYKGYDKDLLDYAKIALEGTML